jgi:predicted DCC family thiol-disulfide oxidoreductase YuxK
LAYEAKIFWRDLSVNSEITKVTDTDWLAGWVFYDAECPSCRRWIARFERTLTLRGFDIAPLQSAWVRECFDLPEAELFSRMRLLTRDGRDLAGADALAFIAGKIWWAWPVYAVSRLPGVLPVLRVAYDRVARLRVTDCSAEGRCKAASNK